jgi:predicted ATPase
VTGRIYFIATDALDAVKIGHTLGPVSERYRVLQTACPLQLKILVSTDGSVRDERDLHARFADLRIRGEWFRREGGLQRLLAQLVGIDQALFPGVLRLGELGGCVDRKWFDQALADALGIPA